MNEPKKGSSSREIDLKDLGLDDPAPAMKQVPPPEIPKPQPRPTASPARPVALPATVQPASPASSVASLSVLLIEGIVIASLGVSLTLYFAFFYHTTVINELGGETYNIGLQQNRLLGFIGGIALGMTGSLLAAGCRIATLLSSK